MLSQIKKWQIRQKCVFIKNKIAIKRRFIFVQILFCLWLIDKCWPKQKNLANFFSTSSHLRLIINQKTCVCPIYLLKPIKWKTPQQNAANWYVKFLNIFSRFFFFFFGALGNQTPQIEGGWMHLKLVIIKQAASLLLLVVRQIVVAGAEVGGRGLSQLALGSVESHRRQLLVFL